MIKWNIFDTDCENESAILPTALASQVLFDDVVTNQDRPIENRNK